VASIKPNNSNSPVYFKTEPGGRRFIGRNMTTKFLIEIAYQIKDFQITGEPSWISSQGFDIEAVAESHATAYQMQLMAQSLLADKFKLTFHLQTKEASIYALVTGKNGLKLKLSPDQTPWTGDHPDDPGTTGANMDIRAGSLTGDSIPMAMFVNFLSMQVGRTVINKTGLTGRYVIELRWTPDAAHGPSGAGDPLRQPDSTGSSFFTAIQEQLGLRLESTRGPVSVLVIDHVEKPSSD
jgi:uncharacterized protein (TIGR03435 family)